MLEYRATILEYDVAARALRQLAGDLVIDNLVLISLRALQLWRRQLDHLDRHPLIEAQT